LGSCIYFRSGGRLNIDGIGNNSANLVIDAHDPVSGSGSIILKNGSLTWPAAFRCPETGTPSNYTYWTMEEMNQPYETTDYTLPQYWYAGIQPLPGVTLIRNTGARFVNSPLAGTKFATIDGASAYNQGGLSVWHPKHGQLMSLMQNSAEVTMSANPTTNWQGIPAGSLVVGVTARVTQAITGVDSIDIGPYGGTVDLWGHAVGTSLGTTSNLANGTATTPLIFTALSYVTITGNGGLGHFTGGKVRLTVHYLKLTAPTD
jgi:hypothetical protein